MTYQRKTRDYWSIQQYTGAEYKWEEVNAEDTWKDAKRSLREYRENQPEYPVRARRKRERIQPPDPTFCTEHKCYFVECGKLGHGENFDPKETL
jgi:hypothetical protein